MIRGRKILNIAYSLIGLYFSYSSFRRLWDEGTFGNETHILFLFMVGPYIGFQILFAGLFLTVGQALDFFDKKFATGFTRISFLFAITTLITIYFIYGKTYIWSELIDFLVFGLITTLFYLPVVIIRQKRPANVTLN